MLKLVVTDLTSAVLETLVEWVESQTLCTVEMSQTDNGLEIESYYLSQDFDIETVAERSTMRDQLRMWQEFVGAFTEVHTDIHVDLLLAV